MRTITSLTIGLMVSLSGAAWAQNFPVTPASPSSFTKRDIGGGVGTSVAGVQRVKGKTTVVQYIAVTEVRSWKNNADKTIIATMLAFNNGSAEKAKRPLTLIKSGKVRLLVSGKNKPSLVTLDQLSVEDQAFVKALVETNKKAAQAPKPASAQP